jgi:hypothetical protein
MYILAYFIGTDGVPETGLTVTGEGYKVEDRSHVLSSVSFTEIGDGWYYYNHSSADSSYHYVYTVDGGATLPGLLRYAAGASSGDSADISTLITNLDTVSDDIKNQYYAFRDMRRKHPEWNPMRGKENEQR